MEFRIRSLQAADIEAVVEFSLRAWEPVFASFARVLGSKVYQQVYPDWRASQAKTVETVCRDDKAMVSVAEVDGRPVGYVAVYLDVDAGSGEIDMLAVDPEAQGAGIGTALTDYAVEQMRAAGVALASVGTGGEEGHAPARRTYEKAGFVGLPLVRYYKKL